MGRGGGGDAHGVPERVVDADLGGHAHEGCERRGPVRPGGDGLWRDSIPTRGNWSGLP